MEGVVVRGISPPSRWRSCMGRALVVAKPSLQLSMRPRRTGVRCCLGQDIGNYLQAHVLEAGAVVLQICFLSFRSSDSFRLLIGAVLAVRMVPSSQGQLFMTLTDGREVEVNHVNPSKGHLLYKTSTPTIFLKMSDDSGLMLPIVVGEAAVIMLMKGLRDGGKLGRPNQYQILKDIVGALNFEARMIRVTERVLDTYYARIYIGKPGDKELFSVDARPSDAINLAVRCKIPIYVNKSIVAADAVRPVYKTANQKEVAVSRLPKNDSFMDSADVQPDIMAEEITLLRNMLVAVVEERYVDAARWRDELTKLRVMSGWQLGQI